MGNIVSVCKCSKKEEEEEEESDSSDSQIEEIEKDIKLEPKEEIPKTATDISFTTDTLVKAYNYSPYQIYQDIELLGGGTYGVVKKVCLKNNKETVRAMKIIDKQHIEKGGKNNTKNALEKICENKIELNAVVGSIGHIEENKVETNNMQKGFREDKRIQKQSSRIDILEKAAEEERKEQDRIVSEFRNRLASLEKQAAKNTGKKEKKGNIFRNICITVVVTAIAVIAVVLVIKLV